MSRGQLIEEFEKKYLSKVKSSFGVGDTVKVHVKIKEGKKERTQIFMGIVIGRRKGGIGETFTVYRNAYGSSMERVFLLNSPSISKIEVVKYGDVSRAKLYYLRGETGKKAKVKEKIVKKKKKAGA